MLVLIFGWLAANLLTLTGYPPATCDEAFYMRSALRFTRALASGQWWPRARALFYLPHGRLYWLALGGAADLLGETLFAGRLVSLLGWALLVAATYLVGGAYADRRAGLWAALLVATAPIAFYTGRLARPDIVAAAASVALVGLLPAMRRQRRGWLFLLFGLGGMLTLDLHLNLLHIVWPVFLILGLTFLSRRRFAALLWLAAGALLGAAVIVVLHVGTSLGPAVSLLLNDPAGFASSYVGGGGGSLPGMLISSAVSFSRFWWGSYAWFARVLSLLPAVLFVSGLVSALVGRDEPLRLLAVVVVLSSLTFAVINAEYQVVGYAMMWLPFYAVLGVAVVFRLAERLGRARWLVPAGLSVMLALNVLGDAYLVWKTPPGSYEAAAARLTAGVEPGSRVLANSTWWHALHGDYTFLDETLVAPENSSLWWNSVPGDGEGSAAGGPGLMAPNELPPDQAAAWVRDVLSRLQPDVVLDDGRIGCQSSATALSEAFTANVGAQCSARDGVSAGEYGAYTRYTCGWPAE